MFSSPYEITMFSITVATLTLQFYILFLIYRKSPDQMKNYRFVLYHLTFWDIIFAASLGLAIEPLFVLSSAAMIIKGFAAHFGRRFSEICGIMVVFSCVNVLCLQLYALIFRYLAVIQNQVYYIRFTSKPVKICFYVVMIIFSTAICVAISSLLVKPEEHEGCILKYNLRNTSAPKIKMGDVVVILDRATGRDMDVLNYIAYIVILVQLACVGLVYATLKTLRQNSLRFSQTTYRLYLQFTILLGCQLASPVIFIGFPICLAIIGKIKFGSLNMITAQTCVMSCSVYGFVNTAITIGFISPYRRHFLSTFVLPWLNPLMRRLGLENWLNSGTTTKVINIQAVTVVARSVG